jgi:hypothetical protein
VEKHLDTFDLPALPLLHDRPRFGSELLNAALDLLVVVERPPVLEIVVAAMDDPGVRLPVIGVDDDVDAPDLDLADGVEDRSTILDLDVIERARARRAVVQVQTDDLAQLPIEARPRFRRSAGRLILQTAPYSVLDVSPAILR